jgi:polyhydroxyalkanoate synthesis regulator phasin
MSENKNEGLKKVLYTGVGMAVVTADMAGKAIGSLAKKGEQAIEKGKVMNEELKRKRAAAKADVDAVTESLKDLTKEEIETVRAKLADLEGRFVETKTDVAMNVEDITARLEKMGRDEIEILKASIDEIRKNWSDDNDRGAQD